eukprot:TRINITY_DN33561_c0_g1_i1.p1 TRINITY_DN33561_c0_g1~~TRINITY_DN33561_c0_g1_i1.p1  ORF type:complete len:381 (-),score=65.06 TRINITY_DN33561_c0_g1_i1:33-1148(-)
MRRDAIFCFLAVILIRPALGIKSRRPLHRLYYQRDHWVGLSNVKLQFESLVAMAAVYNRELVIPSQASPLNHMDVEFHERDLWNMTTLGKVIRYHIPEPGYDGCPQSAYVLPKKLWEMDFDQLPLDQDWCFHLWETRIQHFECLRLKTEADRETASLAVFNGLQLQDHYVEDAKAALKRIGLSPGQFSAAHVRMTDLLTGFAFAGGSQTQGESIAAEKAHQALDILVPPGVPLLLATDKGPDSPVIKRILQDSKASRVFTSNEAFANNTQNLHRAMMDIVMCSLAGNFIGTPDSTFSNSIFMLRKKLDFCQLRRLPVTRQGAGQWFSSEVEKLWNDEREESAECWSHVTSWEHLQQSAPKDCDGARALSAA